MCYVSHAQKAYAPVAQLDRVSDSDSEGHAFESHRAYIEKALVKIDFTRVFCMLGYYAHICHPTSASKTVTHSGMVAMQDSVVRTLMAEAYGASLL